MTHSSTHHAAAHHTAAHHAAAHHTAVVQDMGIAFAFLLLIVVVIGALTALLVFAARRQSDRLRVYQVQRKDEATRWLAAIEESNLPEIHPVGIMPIAGERFVYQQNAQYGQTHSQRVYGGGNRALYVPLGHGFRYRVGGNSGTSQTVTNFMWGPFGTVFVSNMRVVFKATNSTEICIAPYRQILAYDCHADGLSLQIERLGLMQFRTGDAVLGTLFQKVVTGKFLWGGAQHPASAPRLGPAT